MMFTTDQEKRWNLFEHYAAKMIARHPEFGFTEEEYGDFIYLKYYFGPLYLEKKKKPWLPSVFDKMRK